MAENGRKCSHPAREEEAQQDQKAKFAPFCLKGFFLEAHQYRQKVGSDLIVSGPMHLTLKLDYLCALSQSSILPHGPRVYVGFLFYH